MTFEELDQRTILWNEIANGHRDLNERIAMQAMLCKEEMAHEFVLNYFSCACGVYSSGLSVSKSEKIQFLDDFADSRFVFIEYENLCKKSNQEPLRFINHLFACISIEANYYSVSDVITEAYRRVIDSNFSKFVELSEKHDLMWAQGEARKMSERYLRKIKPELTQGYWVFRDQNGKIRKPSTFKPVDLSDLV